MKARAKRLARSRLDKEGIALDHFFKEDEADAARPNTNTDTPPVAEPASTEDELIEECPRRARAADLGGELVIQYLKCTECGLDLLPGQARFRTTRSHKKCGDLGKQLVYALNCKGGKDLADMLKQLKNTTPDMYSGVFQQCVEADGLTHAIKEKLFSDCPVLHKKGSTVAAKESHMVDETEYAREIRRRRGGKIRSWAKDFHAKIKNGCDTETINKVQHIALPIQHKRASVGTLELTKKISGDGDAAMSAITDAVRGQHEAPVGCRQHAFDRIQDGGDVRSQRRWQSAWV